jgi:glycosyltransferase involved in cell wall biosynthesis
MRLLIVTQAVDEKDHYLSFFTGWITVFAQHFESIEVICLKGGAYTLPKNVRVFSLGKEEWPSRLQYIVRFYRYIWQMRNEYDVVLVHMNQEYVLLGGIIFALLRKPLYFWRNHYAGSLLTDIAVQFCRKVFYTSKSSYTAKFKHAVRMPVGVDIQRFAMQDALRIPRSILFFARFAPSKRPDVFVQALSLLKQRGVSFTASVVGSALPQDQEYQRRVKIQAHDHGLDSFVTFAPGVPNTDAPHIYAKHDIFVDLGSSGMYNKMIFEAASSGCLVLAASKDFQEEMGTEFGFLESDAGELARALEKLLAFTDEHSHEARTRLRAYAERNSLAKLATRIETELQ